MAYYLSLFLVFINGNVMACIFILYKKKEWHASIKSSLLFFNHDNNTWHEWFINVDINSIKKMSTRGLCFLLRILLDEYSFNRKFFIEEMKTTGLTYISPRSRLKKKCWIYRSRRKKGILAADESPSSIYNSIGVDNTGE